MIASLNNSIDQSEHKWIIKKLLKLLRVMEDCAKLKLLKSIMKLLASNSLAMSRKSKLLKSIIKMGISSKSPESKSIITMMLLLASRKSMMMDMISKSRSSSTLTGARVNLPSISKTKNQKCSGNSDRTTRSFDWFLNNIFFCNLFFLKL